MATKNKYQLIKAGRTYTVAELAALLSRHIRTVQVWIKYGLEVIDPNSRPYLISGTTAKLFLQNKSKRKKVKLANDEFYCLKCRCARNSQPDKLKFEFTGKQIGDGQKQIRILGTCTRCYSPVQRFSSEKNITKLYNSLMLKEWGLILIDKGDSYLNTDIERNVI